MGKIITRDRLAEFVELMWDAGLKVDLTPSEKAMTVWSGDYSKHTYVSVVEPSDFGNIVGQVVEAVKVEEA